MKELAMEVVQLSKTFDGNNYVFKDLSFTIKKGEVVALIGPNGSGKTSLVKILLGIYKKTTGHVHNYEPVIGYVPQKINQDQFSPMTVRELLSLKLKSVSFWSSKKKCEKEMLEILKKTNIEDTLHKQIRHLSGGQFQRLMIAYALMNDPGLLILDEPVAGIDIHGEHEFYEMLEDIHQKQNITIIMISHDIDVVYKYATQVICLNKSLICKGVPSDVLTKETLEKTFSLKHGVYHHHHNPEK